MRKCRIGEAGQSFLRGCVFPALSGLELLCRLGPQVCRHGGKSIEQGVHEGAAFHRRALVKDVGFAGKAVGVVRVRRCQRFDAWVRVRIGFDIGDIRAALRGKGCCGDGGWCPGMINPFARTGVLTGGKCFHGRFDLPVPAAVRVWFAARATDDQPAFGAGQGHVKQAGRFTHVGKAAGVFDFGNGVRTIL